MLLWGKSTPDPSDPGSVRVGGLRRFLKFPRSPIWKFKTGVCYILSEQFARIMSDYSLKSTKFDHSE